MSVRRANLASLVRALHPVFWAVACFCCMLFSAIWYLPAWGDAHKSGAVSNLPRSGHDDLSSPYGTFNPCRTTLGIFSAYEVFNDEENNVDTMRMNNWPFQRNTQFRTGRRLQQVWFYLGESLSPWVMVRAPPLLEKILPASSGMGSDGIGYFQAHLKPIPMLLCLQYHILIFSFL